MKTNTVGIRLNGHSLSSVFLLLAILLGLGAWASPARAGREAVTIRHQAPGQPAVPLGPISPLVAVAISGNGSSLLGHASTLLTVQVSNRRGRPQGNESVTFTAPLAGARGTFAAPRGASTIVRVRTDRQGRAGVQLTSNGIAGIYLVNAAVNGTGAFATFAITNVRAPVRATLSATMVRSRMLSRLLHFSETDPTHVLFGPVLLLPGTGIQVPKLAAPLFPTDALQVRRPTWFFWVDDQPQTLFAHPSRFILVDTTDNSTQLTSARILQRGWWPEITLPGAKAANPFLPADDVNGSMISRKGRSTVSVRIPVVAETAAPAARPAGEEINRSIIPLKAWTAPVSARGRGDAETADDDQPDECAILIYGPGRGVGSFQSATTRMKAYLRQHGVTTVYGSGNAQESGGTAQPPAEDPPATAQDLETLIRQAQANPKCKRLIIQIVGHGGEGTFSLASDGGNTGEVTYARLAQLLEPLGDKGIRFTLLLGGCYSGSAEADLVEFNVPGTLLTAASSSRVAFGTAFSGDLFITNILDHIQTSLAGEDPWTALPAAAKWAQTNGAYLQIYWSHPQIVRLTGLTDKTYALPDILIPAVGKKADVLIARPPTVPMTGTLTMTVSVPNTAIADIEGQGTYTEGLSGKPSALGRIPVGIQVNVDGVAVGQVPYTVVSREPGVRYIGHGTIYVGSTLKARPNPLQIPVGTEGLATIERGGALLHIQSVGELIVTSDDPTIADVAGRITPFPHGASTTIVSVVGKKIGATRVRVRDAADTVGTSFTVIVTGPNQSSTTGGSQGDLRVLPPSLKFSAAVGDIDSQAFLLVNEGDHAITLTAVTAAGTPPFSMSSTSSCHAQSTLPSKGSTCIGHVWFQPPDATDYTGTVQIVYIRDDGVTGSILVPLSGTVPTPSGRQLEPGITDTVTRVPTGTATQSPTGTPTTIPALINSPTPTTTTTPALINSPTPTSTATPIRVGSGSLNPPSIDFGSVLVGTSSNSQPVTLTNSGDAPLTLGGVTLAGSQGSQFTLGPSSCNGSIDPHADCTIQVSFHPTGPGHASAVLQTADSGPGSPHSATLTGTGIIAPSISGSAVSFGTQPVETTSGTVTVTITNTGSIAFSITVTGISGADASAFSMVQNTCTGTLAPGAQCQAQLTFHPSSTGNVSGTLNITTNPQAGGVTSFALSGIGI